ncbi:Uncharacterised protein [Vibrio cholerae]|nr:Uncharacterised protein [Vibrio cholerae]
MFNHPKLSNSSYCSFCLSLFTFILRVYCFKSTNQGLGH